MESPAIASNADFALPPVLSLDGKDRPERKPRDYRSFLARLDHERAQLSQALEAFQVELAVSVAG